jgi:probable rRNA maturation factor
MKGKISFFNEGIKFTLQNKGDLRLWINDIIEKDGKSCGIINYIFCNDSVLLDMNKTYLNHNTLTDIITFDNTENSVIAGEIYISTERVKENALLYSQSFPDELHRVMIHGVLHLLGNKDKSAKDKAMMREKEDLCLSLLKSHNTL